MTDPTVVAAAADFIDATLQKEGTWYRADDVGSRLGGLLGSYGSSVGAVRGTVRDALRKFRTLEHDGVTQLASALWSQPGPGVLPIYERRLAAVVLLQSRVSLLLPTDLTRIEGFLRTAHTAELTDPLLADVVVPLLRGLGPRDRQRADVILARWRIDPAPGLPAAAAYLDRLLDTDAPPR